MKTNQDDSAFRDFLRKHEGHTITLQRREGGVRQSSSIRAVDFEKAKERPLVGEVTAAFCCGQKALRYAGDAR